MADEHHRSDERVPVEFQIYYIHKGDYILSFSKNISLGGMFLTAADPPEPGSKVKLIFPVEEYYEAEVMAIVIWVNLTPQQEKNGMGVQFLSPLSAKLKETIMRDIKRVEILKEFEGFA
ncbi:MAG: PilZ domain-containing protein [Deltaproteobacteria bacterium]|jgi:c-di-GMP-binding flagellar brake protein YcgR|nr:PilZ domain-containing protein [Deltaproteobacteria bacterium]